MSAAAREHIRMAIRLLNELDAEEYTHQAGVYALLSIACTLADMADMDADTRTQPAVRPPAPPPSYSLYHPGDTERIPT